MNEWKKFVLIEGFIGHFLFTRHCSRCFTYINSFDNKWINKLKLKLWPITQLNAFPKGHIIFPKVINAWKIPFQQPAVVVVQLLSCPTLLTPWTAAQHTSLFSTISWSLLKLISIVSVMPSILSSVASFSFCLQPFPASGSFPASWLFASGGQSIGVSASASALPMNIQGCFPLGLTALISSQSTELSRVFSSTTVQKHQFFGDQLSLWSKSHFCTWVLEKPQLLLCGPVSAKWCRCFWKC